MATWLHVSAGYAPIIGGGEKYIQTMSERFVEAGDDVVVATTNAACAEHWWDPRQPALQPGVDYLNGVRVIRSRVAHLPAAPYSCLLVRRLAGWVPPRDEFIPLLNTLGNYLPWIPGFEGVLEKQAWNAQLVHAINVIWEGPVLAAHRFARRRGLPFVFTPFLHIGEPQVERYYTRPHQLRLLRASDAVIAQTELEANALIHRGVPAHRLHMLGMGVDLDTLHGGDAERFRQRYGIRAPLVTFMGAVTYDKGAVHLTQAMRRLWQRNQQATLALAGRAIAVGGYNRFFDQLSGDERQRILRLGEVAGELKQDLLAATDVFVMPSRVDAFGIVFLEAWAYGIPVIGAAAGGIPGVIEHNVDGLLVPFGDVDKLADSIADLLNDQAKACAFGARGRAKVEARYTWDRVYSDLRAIYTRLASG